MLVLNYGYPTGRIIRVDKSHWPAIKRVKGVQQCVDYSGWACGLSQSVRDSEHIGYLYTTNISNDLESLSIYFTKHQILDRTSARCQNSKVETISP